MRTRSLHRALLGVCVALLVACRGGAASDDEATEPTGSESGETSPDACSSELPCEAGYCVASWDAQTRMRGPAQCVPQCVGELELARFCIDDASCCAGLECAIDGLCEPPWQPGTDTSESDSTGSSESGSTDSGSTDSGSTDSGSTDSGSSTSG